MPHDLAILGAGNMAEAITHALLTATILRADQIIASDVSPARREHFQNQLHIRTTDDNLTAARDAKILLLSVKPQHMAAALAGIGNVIADQTLIISIAAGISTTFIEKHLGAGKNWRVIRAMPNTPMLVGEGMVAIAAGAHATGDDLATARKLFQSAADVIELDEEHIDTVTAVSGSGPAYFFLLVENMIRAATELGLTPDHARQLAVKTAQGAAKMLAASPDESPQELRRKVTSPGGTTEAAIHHMLANHLDQIIIDAIKRAQRRGKELGQ